MITSEGPPDSGQREKRASEFSLGYIWSEVNRMAEAMNTANNVERQAINIKLEHSTYKMLEALQTFYRAPTITHTIRLLIEDGYELRKADIEADAKLGKE